MDMTKFLLPRRVSPQRPHEPYLGPTGYVGGHCPCGQFKATARTLEGMYAGLDAHQETDACAFGVAARKREAEGVTATT